MLSAPVVLESNAPLPTAGVSSSYIVTVIPTISVATGAAVTVGAGKTMIIDVLKIGDL